MPNGHRGIIHEVSFDSEFEALEKDAEVREEIISGIDWMLSRRPEIGFTEGHGIWIKEHNDPARKRRFWIFYTFSEKNVILLSIKLAGPFEIWPR
jgi:hypothetical protein